MTPRIDAALFDEAKDRYRLERHMMRRFCRHAVRWLYRAAGVPRGFVASPAHVARRLFSAVEPSAAGHDGRMVAYVVRYGGHSVFHYTALTPEAIGWACGSLAYSALKAKFLGYFRRFFADVNDHNRIAHTVEHMIARDLVCLWNDGGRDT